MYDNTIHGYDDDSPSVAVTGHAALATAMTPVTAGNGTTACGLPTGADDDSGDFDDNPSSVPVTGHPGMATTAANHITDDKAAVDTSPPAAGAHESELPSDDGQPYDDFDDSPQNLARKPRYEHELQQREEQARQDRERLEKLRQPWEQNADKLAQWTDKHLVNRDDVWGQYKSLHARGKKGHEKALTRPPVKDRGQVFLTEDVIIAHYRGRKVSDVIGLHSTAADGTCLWAAWDIDYHDHDPNPPDPAINLQHVRALYQYLVGLGLHPLLTESNGSGGFHLRVVFTAPIPVANVYAFAQGAAALVIEDKVEAFPKQGVLNDETLGNWLRLPGRHHTREHFSKVWSGDKWLEGAEAIELILATTGDDPHIIIEAASKMTPTTTKPVNNNAVTSNAKSPLAMWLREILDRVPLQHLDDYHDWLRVGFAIRNELPGEEGLTLWDEVSQRSENYDADACSEKWQSFTDAGDGKKVTIGTLIHWIHEEDFEYVPPRKPGSNADQQNVQNPEGLPSVMLPGSTSSISQCAKSLGKLLAKTGHYFSRGGAIHTVKADKTNDPFLEAPTPAQMASCFEEVAALKKTTIGGKDANAICNETTAKLLILSNAFNNALPRIILMSPCPVLIEREGRLIQVCGYDEASGILAHGERAPDMAVENAVRHLKKMLADFCFATPGDFARALAALITPAGVFGDLLKSRAPMDLGEADESQAGKGYRAKLTAAVYRNRVRTITQQKGGVGSLEEKFSSVLISGANFISFDNIRGNLNSPTIESFLTEDYFQARRPYLPSIEIDARRIMVFMTSNSAELTPDLTNRSSCVRIKKRPEDYKYRIFAREEGGDMLAHVRLHQSKYLGAVFAIWRAWFSAGKPVVDSAGHDFRRWAGVLGWISENIFHTGKLLDGHREVQRRMATPALNWLRDVAIAVQRAGKFGVWLQTSDIIDIVMDTSVQIPGLAEGQNPFDDSVRNGVYSAMGKRMGACFVDKTAKICITDLFRVERKETRNHAKDWNVKSYRFSDATGDAPALEDDEERQLRKAVVPGEPEEYEGKDEAEDGHGEESDIPPLKVDQNDQQVEDMATGNSESARKEGRKN